MVSLLLAAAASAGPTCGTLRALADAPSVRTGPVASIGGLAERDVFGVPNLVVSEHFAGWFGGSGAVGREDVEELLAEFEVAWQFEVETLGHPAPYGTDAFRFNVYVGDTGGNTPTSYGAGGYYSVDPEGWPMIVVAEASMGDPSFRAHTAAHEFYHALQGVTSRYAYDGEGAWYWEATAEWAALQVDPTNAANGPFLFGYLLLPALPVNAFDYPDSFDLEEYHQYGAFLFPYDLTEAVGVELVVDTWLDRGDDPDPLEVMRARLAAAGHDLDELWLDHTARATAFDYPLGGVWSAQTSYVGRFYPEASFETKSASGAGGEGRVRGEDAPRRYGTARIVLNRPDLGRLDVVVDGDEEGTEGSPATYGARLVRMRSDGSVEYDAVEFDGVHGAATLDLSPDDDEVWLVVSAWTERLQQTRWEDEAFPFDWSMTVTEAPPATSTGATTAPGSSGVEPMVCGCASGGGPVPLAALLALPWLRRRRWTSTG